MSVIVDPGSGVADEGVETTSYGLSTSRDPSTWAPNEHINKRSSIPFILLHFLPLLAFFTGVTWTAVWLAVTLYFVRMLAITGGYHRYFSHRSYRLERVPQFVLAFIGTTAAQKGPLWWAAHHRAHHKYADTERDIHSPIPRVLVEPRRLDPLRQVQQDRLRRDQGLHEVPRAGLARQARLGRAVERSASRATSSAVGAVW